MTRPRLSQLPSSFKWDDDDDDDDEEEEEVLDTMRQIFGSSCVYFPWSSITGNWKDHLSLCTFGRHWQHLVVLLRFGSSEILHWASSAVRDTDRLPEAFTEYILARLSSFRALLISLCPNAQIYISIPFPQEASSFAPPLALHFYHILVGMCDGDFASDLDSALSRLSSTLAVCFPLPARRSMRELLGPLLF